MPDRAVAGGTDVVDGKVRVLRLQLLQADHVRLLALQPFEQVGPPRADAVDVEGSDFQTIHDAPHG